MRILIDIEDSDLPVILATKDADGHFSLVTMGSEACRARVVGRAIPESLAGEGGTYKAYYTIIMLEEMEAGP